jgi:hypothetical protein
MERVDLGPCRAIRREGDAERVAVLLPGQSYPIRAPVLWFAREAAMSRGWRALEVLGEPVASLAGMARMTEAIMRFAGRA